MDFSEGELRAFISFDPPTENVLHSGKEKQKKLREIKYKIKKGAHRDSLGRTRGGDGRTPSLRFCCVTTF